MKDIEVIDKENNKITRINPKKDELIIHPVNGYILYLKDYELENHNITGIILKKNGDSLICYEMIKNKGKKNGKKKVKHRN